MRHIGDAVLTTPLIQALRQGVADASIDVVLSASSAPVLLDHPHINRMYCLASKPTTLKFWQMLKFALLLRRAKYDAVADLTSNDRSALLTVATGARLRIGFCGEYPLRESIAYSHVIPSVLGYGHAADHYRRVADVLKLSRTGLQPYLHVSSRRSARVEGLLKKEGVDPAAGFVVLHPGGRRWYKRWPATYFAALGDQIRQHCRTQVVISGGKEDVEMGAQIASRMNEPAADLTAKIDLALLPALIRKALCLVGNDSAPIHIATAVNTPAVALFGPTNWRVWGPRRGQDHVIAAEPACCSCGHHRSDCPLGENYCTGQIPLASVWEVVQKVLQLKIGAA